jgi:uncharacterized protein
MPGEIPPSPMRFEPGYTFEQPSNALEFCVDNIVVGSAGTGGEAEALLLGKVAEYQAMRKNVWLDTKRAHAVYVMGKRRSGKTYTLGVLVEGLAAEGMVRQGNAQQGVLVLDTMNVFLTMHHTVTGVYGQGGPQASELRSWGLTTEALNVVFWYPRGTPAPPEGTTREIALRPSDLTGEDWAALFGVDTYSEPIGQLIAEVYEKVALEGYTAATGERVGASPRYGIGDILACLGSAADLQPPRYEQRTIEAVRRRLNAVERLDIFNDQGVEIRDLFVPGQVSILLLRDLEHSIRALFVGVLVKKIMEMRSLSERYERLAAVHRAKLDAGSVTDRNEAERTRETLDDYLRRAGEGLPRGWIVIDEAHNYMPARGIVASGEPLKRYVNEGRNLGLSIVVATQNPSGLDPAIRRNADVLIAHSISMRDDISAIEGMVNTFVPDTFQFGRQKIESRVFEQLLRSLPQGYAVLSSDTIGRVMVVRIRPRLTSHGGIDY